jgi:hypothetical protein
LLDDKPDSPPASANDFEDAMKMVVTGAAE